MTYVVAEVGREPPLLMNKKIMIEVYLKKIYIASEHAGIAGAWK